MNDRPEIVGRRAAKVQFLAIQNEVIDYIKEGFPAKSIWNFFVQKKKVTMTYQTFCRYVKKINGSIERRNAVNPNQEVKSITGPPKVIEKKTDIQSDHNMSELI